MSRSSRALASMAFSEPARAKRSAMLIIGCIVVCEGYLLSLIYIIDRMYARDVNKSDSSSKGNCHLGFVSILIIKENDIVIIKNLNCW